MLHLGDIFPYDCCCEMLLSDTTAPRLFGTTSTRAFTAGSTGTLEFRYNIFLLSCKTFFCKFSFFVLNQISYLYRSWQRQILFIATRWYSPFSTISMVLRLQYIYIYCNKAVSFVKTMPTLYLKLCKTVYFLSYITDIFLIRTKENI